MGIKTPLMKIRGSRTTFESNIMFAGESVGRADSRLPREEKQKADSMMTMAKMMGFITVDPKMRTPADNESKETHIPYKKPAIISPETMTPMGAGVETRRSRVLVIVSHGAITGVEEEEIKKSVMPSIPGKRAAVEIPLPIANAQKRQMGKKMPKIKTGGLT